MGTVFYIFCAFLLCVSLAGDTDPSSYSKKLSSVAELKGLFCDNEGRVGGLGRAFAPLGLVFRRKYYLYGA